MQIQKECPYLQIHFGHFKYKADKGNKHFSVLVQLDLSNSGNFTEFIQCYRFFIYHIGKRLVIKYYIGRHAFTFCQLFTKLTERIQQCFINRF